MSIARVLSIIIVYLRIKLFIYRNPRWVHHKGKVSTTFEDNKHKRQQKFYDRKKGILKKAHELSVICGVNIFIKFEAESGNVYTYGADKMHDEYCTTGLKPSADSRENRLRYDTNSESILIVEKFVSHRKKVQANVNTSVTSVTPQRNTHRHNFIRFKDATCTPIIKVQQPSVNDEYVIYEDSKYNVVTADVEKCDAIVSASDRSVDKLQTPEVRAPDVPYLKVPAPEVPTRELPVYKVLHPNVPGRKELSRWVTPSNFQDLNFQATNVSDVTVSASPQPNGPPVEEPPPGGEPVEEPPPGGEPVEGPPPGGEPVEEPPLGGEPVEEPPLGGEPVEEPPSGGEPVEGPPLGGEPVEEPPPHGAAPEEPPPHGAAPDGSFPDVTKQSRQNIFTRMLNPCVLPSTSSATTISTQSQFITVPRQLPTKRKLPRSAVDGGKRKRGSTKRKLD